MKQLLFLVQNDLKSRFAGSRLGILWAVASPAVTIGIYWFVYTVALNGGNLEGVPYLHFLIAGIVPWFFFADGLTGGAAAFWDYKFLVCKIRFQTERLPLIRVCSAFGIHLVLLLLSWLVLALRGVPFGLGQFWVLFWMAGGFCLTLSLGRILALWHACLKDVGYALHVVIQLGFWLTPVFWSASALPKALARLCSWNPAAVLVEGYRGALLFGAPPKLPDTLIFWGEVLVFYGVSTVLMRKIKPTLADRL